MKKINKILIIILVCVLILFGGILAYLYFGTDTFKSNDEIFFKLLKNEEKVISEFIDNNLIEYLSKLEEKSFTSKSEFTFDLEIEDKKYKKITDNVNNLIVTSEMIVDNKNNSSKNNIVIDYGKNVEMPFELIKENEIYGLKNKYLNKDMFFAIENKDLKSFFNKLGMDSENIPDKIEFLDNKKIFTKEEIENIKNDIIKIINDNLYKENFTKEKIDNKVKYSLNLDKNKYLDINIELINYFKNNSELIEKMLSNDVKKLSSEKIIIKLDKMIRKLEKLKEEESKSNYFNLNLISTDKKLVNIYLKIENEEIFNIKKLDENKFKGYEIELNKSRIIIKKNTSENGLKYNFEVESLVEEDQVINLKLESDYKGFESMQEIVQNIKFTIGIENNKDNLAEYNCCLSKNTKFDDFLELENIPKDKIYFLNDYSKEDIQSIFEQIINVLRNENIEQMKVLGLEEYENPIIYSNPLFLGTLEMYVYNFANSVFENKIELIEVYNSTFYNYQGIKSGKDAKTLYNLIESHNNTNIDNPNKQVYLTIGGKDYNSSDDFPQLKIPQSDFPLSDMINTSNTYYITFATDKKTGYITACNIR